MSDSQQYNHLDIIAGLLKKTKQWQQGPHVTFITAKAIFSLLVKHDQLFQQHKHLINQQSIKNKEIQIRLNNKISKKDVQNEMANFLHTRSLKQKDELSQYQKLIKQQVQTQQNNVQEIKTICELVTAQQIKQLKTSLETKINTERQEQQSKMNSLKEQLKNKLLENQKQRRDIVSLINEQKYEQSRITQGHLRSSQSQYFENIATLELAQKKTNQHLNQLITHLQQAYPKTSDVTSMIQTLKQQLNHKIKKQQKEKEKSPQPHKKQSTLKQMQAEMKQQLAETVTEFKQTYKTDFKEFKQKILKDTVKQDTVEQLLEKFQNNLLEKYHHLEQQVQYLDRRFQKDRIEREKTFLKQHQKQNQLKIRSQKRHQKASSPHKSVESITSSLARLEKAIHNQQVRSLAKIQQIVNEKLKSSLKEQFFEKQMHKRDKKLCDVVQDICKQYTKQSHSGDTKTALQKLFNTNLFTCYLYRGSKQTKKNSLISWQIQKYNNMVDNLALNQDHSQVTIKASGLYRVQIGLFGYIQSPSYLLVNQTPYATLQKPPSQQSERRVRGSTFSQILLLNAKSRIAVRMSQIFTGQAFINVQQL